MELVEKIRNRMQSIMNKLKHSYDESRYDKQLAKVTYNVWLFLTVTISILICIVALALLFFILGLLGTILGTILRLIGLLLIFAILVLIATM